MKARPARGFEVLQVESPSVPTGSYRGCCKNTERVAGKRSAEDLKNIGSGQSLNDIDTYRKMAAGPRQIALLVLIALLSCALGYSPLSIAQVTQTSTLLHASPG